MNAFKCSNYLVIFAFSVTSGASTSDCIHTLYTGFDSRVKARVVGRLAPGRESVVGFDVVHGMAVVALPHRLVLFRDRRVSLFIEDEVRGVSSDARGNLFIQVKDSSNPERELVKRLDEGGLKQDSTLTTNVRGTLYGTGTKLLVETILAPGQTTILARRQDGAYALMTNIRGELRALSWNRTGLAAVAGSTALIWPTGSKDLIALTTDQGLNRARDICLIGSDRAVVTLSDTAFVLTPNGVSVLVGMRGHCAWDGDTLYLLDERSGLIWSVRGAEKLGTRVGDIDHGEELAESLPPNGSSDSPAALEAARDIGCSEVMRMRSLRENPNTSSIPLTREIAGTVASLLAEANRQLEQGDYSAANESFNLVLSRAKNNAAAKVGLERANRAMSAERDITGSRGGAVGGQGSINPKLAVNDSGPDSGVAGDNSKDGSSSNDSRVGEMKSELSPPTAGVAATPAGKTVYWYCVATGAQDHPSFSTVVFSDTWLGSEDLRGDLLGKDFGRFVQPQFQFEAAPRNGNCKIIGKTAEEATSALQNMIEDQRRSQTNYDNGKSQVKQIRWSPQ